MVGNRLCQLILIGFYCLVNGDYLNSNPYLTHNNYYRPNKPTFYYPEKYFVSQSRPALSLAAPNYSFSNHQVAVKQPTYRTWSNQSKYRHRWPVSHLFVRNQYAGLNQQIESESYNRPIYRRQNQLKKSDVAAGYQKKIDFLDAKNKKNGQPVCKRAGEVCYGWAPYVPENCCKGYMCDHETKSIVGVCRKKVVVKTMTAKHWNIVQRPLTMEELLQGGA